MNLFHHFPLRNVIFLPFLKDEMFYRKYFPSSSNVPEKKKDDSKRKWVSIKNKDVYEMEFLVNWKYQLGKYNFSRLCAEEGKVSADKGILLRFDVEKEN